MRHPFWQESYCRNSYLHRFNIEMEYETGVLEVCEICHKRVFFKVIDGLLSNNNYMAYHFKQVLPPFHPFYPRQQLEDGLISPYA